MSSTKDPKSEPVYYDEVSDIDPKYLAEITLPKAVKGKIEYATTPQATKPVDEQRADRFKELLKGVDPMEIAIQSLIIDIQCRYYQRNEKSQDWAPGGDSEDVAVVKALLTEARIDELKWVKSRSAKHAGIWIDTKGNELDERLTQLNPNKDTGVKK